VVEPPKQRQVPSVHRACAGGDLDGLPGPLDPGVAGEAEVGGRIGIWSSPAANRRRRLLQFFGPIVQDHPAVAPGAGPRACIVRCVTAGS